MKQALASICILGIWLASACLLIVNAQSEPMEENTRLSDSISIGLPPANDDELCDDDEGDDTGRTCELVRATPSLTWLKRIMTMVNDTRICTMFR